MLEIRLFVLYLLIFQFSFAQQEYKHEVYFETDKFNIPETEHNRLILFLSKVVKLDINKTWFYYRYFINQFIIFFNFLR